MAGYQNYFQVNKSYIIVSILRKKIRATRKENNKIFFPVSLKINLTFQD